jgi:hypothetical protein
MRATVFRLHLVARLVHDLEPNLAKVGVASSSLQRDRPSTGTGQQKCRELTGETMS